MIFGSLFGGNSREDTPAVAVVRDITIGRQVRLDALAWRRLSGAAFTLDRDTLEITAQGLIRLDDGSHVHRFYTDDELMLQAVSQSADGSDADDFTLFRPWSSTYPVDRSDTAAFRDRLSRPTWDEAGLARFDRFWYPGDDRTQPPVELWESVYEERTGRPVRHIKQACMLYAREVPPEGQELLLALAMQPEGGDLTHEIMVGLPLLPAEFSA
ncbi:DUF2491 family protein [Sphingomonas sp. 2R-10]|uniref:DUF2491 family protein n=1 Tax=Sphingomonas sp. 2R-10 TaxID=3045148 RepID=UPI0019D006C3|nr:DUF2491 family protein [Sphingomonas sp. 2R-10]MDJ0278780.1 DUF2491 family protein [Sphingomonas sp. 2R-10]